MAHRFNEEIGRVQPKPSARDRTWYRWRMRNNMDTEQDKERFDIHQGILSRIKERLMGKKK